VIGEQLRTPVEELGQRLCPVVGLERVLLLDGHPRQCLPLGVELVVELVELVLSLEQLLSSRFPLLARSDRVLWHRWPSLSPGFSIETPRNPGTHR
jgi:hypothetical protein